jgi:hypothetical protein
MALWAVFPGAKLEPAIGRSLQQSAPFYSARDLLLLLRLARRADALFSMAISNTAEAASDNGCLIGRMDSQRVR